MSTLWQAELADAVRDPAELLRILELDPALLEPAVRAACDFPLRVPRAFIRRMRKGDPDDPLLRQVLPLGIEQQDTPGFFSDPVGDLDSRRGGGLLHKYRGRVLLITTGTCAVHCRYCFRRHFPYREENAHHDAWREALDYLRADHSVNEVILSGGDPLSLGDRSLAELVGALEQIDHIRRLRIHTRQPIVLPSRVDRALQTWLTACRLQKVVVVHTNHARELDASVVESLTALRATGASLFNQSVLLRGVNDSVPALADLSEALFSAGVTPYYLHLLDRVQGAAHFEVPEAEARALIGGLRARVAGYLVPRLVRETPGALGKVVLADAPASMPAPD